VKPTPGACHARPGKAEARKMGTRGTPGFLANGGILCGVRPFDQFVDAIDVELERLNLPVAPRRAAE
jgi:predicted DsbA family dithiol-disulfide isomerase